MGAGPQTFPVGSPAAIELWSSKVQRSAIWNSLFFSPNLGLVGKPNSGCMICQEDSTQKAGNSVTTILRAQMTGHGIVNAAPVEGLGGNYDTFTQTYFINMLTSQPFEQKSELDDQNVSFDVAREGKDANVEWWNVPLNTAIPLQAAGYTCTVTHPYYRPNSRQIVAGAGGGIFDQYSGMNPVNASNLAGRITRPNSVATDQALGASDVFSIDLVDEMAATLPMLEFPFRMVRWKSGQAWLWFLHTDQLFDLERDSRYQAIQDAILQGGGDYGDSTWATGAVRPYKNFVFIPTNWVTPGVHSTAGTPVDNVRRSFICGANAFSLSFGIGHKLNRFQTRMGFANRGLKFWCHTTAIWGLKRNDYNSKAYATFVVPTRATNRGDAIT